MNNILAVYVAEVNRFKGNTILPEYVSEKRSNETQKAVYGLLKYAVKQTFNFDDDFQDLKKDANGKPVGDRYYLSISHKANLIAVAVSNKNVGVDIESVNPNANTMNIWKTIKHQEEASYNINNIEEIIQFWVKKESKFKYDGGKKFVPKDINTLNLDYYIDEFVYNNQKYFLSVYAEDYNNIKVEYLI